jgi:hypothetical protein
MRGDTSTLREMNLSWALVNCLLGGGRGGDEGAKFSAALRSRDWIGRGRCGRMRGRRRRGDVCSLMAEIVILIVWWILMVMVAPDFDHGSVRDPTEFAVSR